MVVRRTLFHLFLLRKNDSILNQLHFHVKVVLETLLRRRNLLNSPLLVVKDLRLTLHVQGAGVVTICVDPFFVNFLLPECVINDGWFGVMFEARHFYYEILLIFYE